MKFFLTGFRFQKKVQKVHLLSNALQPSFRNSFPGFQNVCLKMTSPFFSNGRGRLERRFNSARSHACCFSRYTGYCSVCTGCCSPCVGCHVLCVVYCRLHVGICNLCERYAGTAYAISSSTWATTASMYDMHVLRGLFHPLRGLLQAPCGLLQPLCTMYRRHVGYCVFYMGYHSLCA